jgi:8-oxo-dGTP pyrophosphatase MutT (NUDIX family)
MKKISAALILTNGEVFLGCYSTGNNFYDLPKGQIEENETPIEACIREAKEETGIILKAENLQDLGKHPYNKQKDLHIFLFKTNELPNLDTMDCTTYFTHPYTGKELKEVDGYKYISFAKKEQFVLKNMSKVLDIVQENYLQ